ncbi:hypothetical protein [Reichenbachiella sp. MALMAid0571]|uniref:hypothetical protein n=1 Tax=Reichenbachiella sp. MALMAid0571 TaxID=3143939 RepID=UPI0032DED741
MPEAESRGFFYKGIYDGTEGYDGHVIIEAGRTSDAIFLNNYISSNVYMVTGEVA